VIKALRSVFMSTCRMIMSLIAMAGSAVELGPILAQ
jgi:hypothetical protein